MTKQTKNKPKFTRGPWRRSAFEDDWAIRGAKCDRVIARPNCNFDDAAANAALISAAPEMYALLERVIREGGTRLDIADEILKLLAKARGEDKNIGGNVIVFQGINNMANTKLIKKLLDMIEFICDVVSACNYGTEQLSPSFLERAEKIIRETIGGEECR